MPRWLRWARARRAALGVAVLHVCCVVVGACCLAAASARGRVAARGELAAHTASWPVSGRHSSLSLGNVLHANPPPFLAYAEALDETGDELATWAGNPSDSTLAGLHSRSRSLQYRVAPKHQIVRDVLELNAHLEHAASTGDNEVEVHLASGSQFVYTDTRTRLETPAGTAVRLICEDEGVVINLFNGTDWMLLRENSTLLITNCTFVAIFVEGVSELGSNVVTAEDWKQGAEMAFENGQYLVPCKVLNQHMAGIEAVLEHLQDGAIFNWSYTSNTTAHVPRFRAFLNSIGPDRLFQGWNHTWFCVPERDEEHVAKTEKDLWELISFAGQRSAYLSDVFARASSSTALGSSLYVVPYDLRMQGTIRLLDNAHWEKANIPLRKPLRILKSGSEPAILDIQRRDGLFALLRKLPENDTHPEESCMLRMQDIILVNLPLGPEGSNPYSLHKMTALLWFAMPEAGNRLTGTEVYCERCTVHVECEEVDHAYQALKRFMDSSPNQSRSFKNEALELNFTTLTPITIHLTWWRGAGVIARETTVTCRSSAAKYTIPLNGERTFLRQANSSLLGLFQGGTVTEPRSDSQQTGGFPLWALSLVLVFAGAVVSTAALLFFCWLRGWLTQKANSATQLLTTPEANSTPHKPGLLMHGNACSHSGSIGRVCAVSVDSSEQSSARNVDSMRCSCGHVLGTMPGTLTSSELQDVRGLHERVPEVQTRVPPAHTQTYHIRSVSQESYSPSTRTVAGTHVPRHSTGDGHAASCAGLVERSLEASGFHGKDAQLLQAAGLRSATHLDPGINSPSGRAPRPRPRPRPRSLVQRREEETELASGAFELALPKSPGGLVVSAQKNNSDALPRSQSLGARPEGTGGSASRYLQVQQSAQQTLALEEYRDRQLGGCSGATRQPVSKTLSDKRVAAASSALVAEGAVVEDMLFGTELMIAFSGSHAGQAVCHKSFELRCPENKLLILSCQLSLCSQILHDNVVMRYAHKVHKVAHVEAAHPSWRVWVIEERCYGGTLQQLLDHGGMNPCQKGSRWDRIMKILADVAAGLDCLHSCHIVHGALCPTSIVIKAPCSGVDDVATALSEGRAFCKVADVVAAQFSVPRLPDSNPQAEIIRFYIPPEARAHGGYSTAGDVFSFGVLMWELMNARLVYAERVSLSYRMRAQQYGWDMPGSQYDWHPDFPSMPASVPLGYTNLMKSCLRRVPENRPCITSAVKALASLRQEVASGSYLNSISQPQVSRDLLGMPSDASGMVRLLSLRQEVQVDGSLSLQM